MITYHNHTNRGISGRGDDIGAVTTHFRHFSSALCAAECCIGCITRFKASISGRADAHDKIANKVPGMIHESRHTAARSKQPGLTRKGKHRA